MQETLQIACAPGYRAGGKPRTTAIASQPLRGEMDARQAFIFLRIPRKPTESHMSRVENDLDTLHARRPVPPLVLPRTQCSQFCGLGSKRRGATPLLPDFEDPHNRLTNGGFADRQEFAPTDLEPGEVVFHLDGGQELPTRIKQVKHRGGSLRHSWS